MSKIISLKFKVTGLVQGVFFRNYTVEKAKELSLVGYVYNGSDGCVYGEAQGHEDSIIQFKTWLCTKGSPNSRIDHTDFHETITSQPTYDQFSKTRGHHPPLSLD